MTELEKAQLRIIHLEHALDGVVSNSQAIPPVGDNIAFSYADPVNPSYLVRARAVEFARTVLRDRTAATFLLWSNKHRLWWRPEQGGYTPKLDQAGRYSRDEAMVISQRAGFINGNPHQLPSAIPIREEDAADWFTRVWEE